MKMQCDVCNKESAVFFCLADEAALCGSCDRRVHSANKVAENHRRFHLLSPSPSTFPLPLCDICQEKRGFLFCQQDRAVMCRDCDVPIHNANVHTMKHSRFLLTGITLSTESATSAEGGLAPPDSSVVSENSEIYQEKEEVLCSTSLEGNRAATTNTTSAIGDEKNSSSVSEYLIKMLPGWHVEDFLFHDVTPGPTNSTSTTTCGLTGPSYQGDESIPFVESSGNNLSNMALDLDRLPVWVTTPGYLNEEGIIDKELSEEYYREVRSTTRQKWLSSEMFNVPDFHYDWSSTSKRPRNYL